MRKKLPSTIPTSDLARILGCTPRQVQRLAIAGILPKEEYGTFNLVAAVQAYIKFKSKREQDASDYGVARTNLVEERVSAARLTRLEKEGKLVHVNTVAGMWGKIFITIKTNFMRLPVTAAPRLVNLKSPAAAQQILDPLVRAILEELPPELEIIVDRHAA
jgi:phage terminase Nu1 subunit (DNA packaging protein)